MQNSFKIKMCGTLYLPHDDIISNVIAPLFLCNPAQRTIFRTRQDLRFSLNQLHCRPGFVDAHNLFANHSYVINFDAKLVCCFLDSSGNKCMRSVRLFQSHRQLVVRFLLCIFCLLSRGSCQCQHHGWCRACTQQAHTSHARKTLAGS